MGDWILKDKSLSFAIRIVKLCKWLCEEKKEYVLSKQLLRSGTSIGANVSECVYASSDRDYINKLTISQKECGETLYWLRLLYETSYLMENQYTSIYKDADELMSILVSTLKSMKTK